MIGQRAHLWVQGHGGIAIGERGHAGQDGYERHELVEWFLTHMGKAPLQGRAAPKSGWSSLFSATLRPPRLGEQRLKAHPRRHSGWPLQISAVMVRCDLGCASQGPSRRSIETRLNSLSNGH